MGHGGRRVPWPLALARACRTLGRRLCAPGAAADPAVRLPQKKNAHLIILTRVLVIEDMRTACAKLRARGYMCDHITHAE
eukprot:650971-Pyramimonas_sp.AAC.1